MQNKDAGFDSYEWARGGAWMELLNPAEVFDRIMVEYSYPECTTGYGSPHITLALSPYISTAQTS